MSTGATVFKNQKVNAVKEYDLNTPSMVQVLISGVLDGADVRTSVVDIIGNEAIIYPLSWQASKADTLAAPPLGDGGIDMVHTSKLKFSIVNAGASTDITLSYTAKAIA